MGIELLAQTQQTISLVSDPVPVLNSSSAVDLFSIVFDADGRVERISVTASSTFNAGWVASSFGWTFGSRFAYKDLTAHGADPK